MRRPALALALAGAVALGIGGMTADFALAAPSAPADDDAPGAGWLADEAGAAAPQEDPLPDTVDIRVFRPPPGPPSPSRGGGPTGVRWAPARRRDGGQLGLQRPVPTDDALERAAEAAIGTLLGPEWRIERRGDGGTFVLSGSGVPLPDGATPRSVRGLVADLPELFGEPGIHDELELVADRSDGPSRTIRLRQILNGARVRGAWVLAHFDAAGRLARLASTFRRDLSPVNARLVPAQEAARIAADDLRVLAPGIVILGTGTAEPWIWPGKDGALHVWRVRTATRRPLGSFVTVVDAGTGEVLSSGNLIESSLASGRGNVFRRNSDYPSNPARAALPDLLGSDENPEGRLRGALFEIVDGKEMPVSSTKRSFFYQPFSPAQRDSFDQVQAYYQFEKAHERFVRTLQVGAFQWFDGPAVPVVVNETDDPAAQCNAFYSHDLDGAGTPGFVFGDQFTCSFPNDDVVRDASVVHHEYTHGVVDWLGFDLADAPSNSYQRSISEALADFHAACATNDPVVGAVFGITRDISGGKLYPVDVPCSRGRMEEHCTGEIWSGLLWDLRKSIGPGAETLVFSSLDFMVDNWPSGQVAGEIDFWDAAVALLDADRMLRGGRDAGLIYGLAASRGIFGLWPYMDDNMTIVYQNFDGPGRFRSIGEVAPDYGHTLYFFKAPAGRTVKILVRSVGALGPTFRLHEGTSGYDLVPLGDSTRVSVGEAELRMALPPTTGVFVVDVSSQDAASGPFRITINIR